MLYIASVVYPNNSGTANKKATGYVQNFASVNENRDVAIAAAVKQKEALKMSYPQWDIHVLVGELTQEAVTPVQHFELKSFVG